MEGYKKYRTVHRIAYISFFIYLIMLAFSNSTFGLESGTMPYHIIIPFIIYCIITAGMEILIRKEIRAKKNFKKGTKTKYPNLSGI